jgi:hypothetical protein
MNKKSREIKSIWSDWNSYPSTVDDGKYITIKSFRDCVNDEYNPSSKVCCATIHSILKLLKVEVIKPNGVYNIPSFSAEKKNFVIEWMYNNPEKIIIEIEKPDWI